MRRAEFIRESAWPRDARQRYDARRQRVIQRLAKAAALGLFLTSGWGLLMLMEQTDDPNCRIERAAVQCASSQAPAK